jgi:hypothetical protein
MRRALDVMSRVPYKCKANTEKKWKEKDKKTLIDRVREKFFLLRKLSINIARVNPNKKRRVKSIHKRRKLGEASESKSNNELVSVDNESSVMSSNAIVRNQEQKEICYKLSQP